MKKTIMFYLGSMGRGGAERIVSLLSGFLSDSYRVVILTDIYGEDEYELDSRVERVVLHKTPNKGIMSTAIRKILRSSNIRTACNRIKPDIIIAFIEKAICRMATAMSGRGIPIIGAIRGNPADVFKTDKMRRRANILYAKVDRLIFQTNEQMEFFDSSLWESSIIIPNPVNDQFIRELNDMTSINAFKSDNSMQPKALRIVSVGSLVEAKNFGLLIDAFASIAKDYTEASLTIYGEGRMRSSLESKISDLDEDIATRISLPGRVEGVVQALQGADLFVMTSINEGIPNALMEAMIVGLPVIATDCPVGGPRLLINSGTNGILVDVGDSDAMVSAIRRLLEDREYAIELGNNARQIVDTYNSKAIFDKWDRQIDVLLKKKICFYINSMGIGGTQRVIVNLAQLLEDKGYSIILATTRIGDEEYKLRPTWKRVITDIEDYDISNSRVINYIRRHRKLSNTWRECKPDIIISFIGKNNIMALVTTVGLSIPIIVAVRGEPNMEYNNSILKLLSKTLFIRAKSVILQTERSKEYFPRYIRSKSVVMPNPIAQELVETVDRLDYKKDNSILRIVAVGRVDSNKNHKLAIDAFALIASQNPTAILEIYGDGVDRPKLESYVKSISMSNRIIFMGNVSRVIEKIYSADIFILSSNTEGMPNALIEAMVAGLAVISTDCPCGGPSMLIEDGINGVLVGVNDVFEMAESIEKLINDIELRNRLGSKAKELRNIYDPIIVANRWEALIENYL